MMTELPRLALPRSRFASKPYRVHRRTGFGNNAVARSMTRRFVRSLKIVIGQSSFSFSFPHALSSGLVNGIDNSIKVLEQQAYGFRSVAYRTLGRLFPTGSMSHDQITRSPRGASMSLDEPQGKRFLEDTEYGGARG